MQQYSGVPRRRVLAVLLTPFTIGISQAGGLIQYEIGTPDLALASAGYAARAQDAATAMTNPAGMTRLCQTELMIGVQPLYGNATFYHNANTTVSGTDGINAIGWFPGGGGYFVYDVNPDFKLGLSAYGNLGLPLHYDGEWVGRYYSTESILLGMTVAPSLAYRIHDMWSLGLSVNAMYGILSDKAAIDNSPLGLFRDSADGELKVKNTTWGYGLTFGFLFEPTDCTRFGLTYTTQIKLDFESTVEFTDVFPIIIPGGDFSTPLDLGIKVPRQLMASFFHNLNDRWSLLGNIGWQNWEKFGQVEVSVGSARPRSLTTNLEYDNTWHVALGAQYDCSDLWRYSFGIAYDSSMVSDTVRTPALPVGAAWRFGLGGQYFMNENFNLGFGYTLLWGGDLSVDQSRGILTGRVAGDYNNSLANYFGINLDWKFW
jgi:long-chain fatty acid transport protein